LNPPHLYRPRYASSVHRLIECAAIADLPLPLIPLPARLALGKVNMAVS